MIAVKRRLTYRQDGRWWFAGPPRRRLVGWHPLLAWFRLLDRTLIGPDTGDNHW